MESLLRVSKLSKIFPIEKGMFGSAGSVVAVDNVSFQIQPGEIISLVGESGSGKSTIGKIIQGLLPPTQGELFFEGEKANLLPLRKRAHFVQTIFQDPFSSLNPKLSVGTILKEALFYSQEKKEGVSTENRAVQLLESTGLPKEAMNSYPHQFSGGQKQRIGIARALALSPKLIVADEPVSALDLSIQAQILDLLIDLNHRMGISILLITHDLSVVEYCSSKVLVMKEGRIVEEGLVETIFKSPSQEYTKTLLSSTLSLE